MVMLWECMFCGVKLSDKYPFCPRCSTAGGISEIYESVDTDHITTMSGSWYKTILFDHDDCIITDEGGFEGPDGGC